MSSATTPSSKASSAGSLEERYERRVTPLFAKRTRQVRELIPELGTCMVWRMGDSHLALRGLLGDKAVVTASTVARLIEEVAGRMGGLSESTAG